MEYEIALANIVTKRNEIKENFLMDYLFKTEAGKFAEVEKYIGLLGDVLSAEEKCKTAILVWKLMPSKAEFAQDFSLYIEENLDKAQRNFHVPSYIKSAFNHLIGVDDGF